MRNLVWNVDTKLFHIASHIDFVTAALCEVNAKLTTTRTNAAPENTEDIAKKDDLWLMTLMFHTLD
jgi:hypothetical protein